MTALALSSAPPFLSLRHVISLNWSRVSAWSGSFSLHLLLALMLLVPPVAIKLRDIVKDDTIVATIPSAPLPAVREPDLPVPPVKIKKIAPTPPKPQITITAPIADPVPAQPTAPVNSIAPPADSPAPAMSSDGGASNSEPTALAYGTQTRIPYPQTALRNRAEGKVVLRVLVGTDGEVEQIEIEHSSGSRDLDRAAREAVMKWKFKPGMRGGVAYSSWALVPISFTLPL